MPSRIRRMSTLRSAADRRTESNPRRMICHCSSVMSVGRRGGTVIQSWPSPHSAKNHPLTFYGQRMFGGCYQFKNTLLDPRHSPFPRRETPASDTDRSRRGRTMSPRATTTSPAAHVKAGPVDVRRPAQVHCSAAAHSHRAVRQVRHSASGSPRRRVLSTTEPEAFVTPCRS